MAETKRALSKMQKDFKKWHSKKCYVENERPRVFFKAREIWLCYLGENVGYEQDGRGDDFLRPVIILKKSNNEIFWATPLTRTEKKNQYYFSFQFLGKGKSIAILSQIKLIDAKRLKYKMGDMKVVDYEVLKKQNQAIACLILLFYPLAGEGRSRL